MYESREIFAEGFTARLSAQRIAENRAKAAQEEREMVQRKVQAKLAYRACPKWAEAIMAESAAAHGVSLLEIITDRRRGPCILARDEAAYRIKAEHPKLSSPKIAGWFGKDHTSILLSWARHAASHGLPPLTTYNMPMMRERRRLYHLKRRDIAPFAPSASQGAGG